MLVTNVYGDQMQLEGWSNTQDWYYYRGTKGACAWSKTSDSQGWYHSVYFKPVGAGARQGTANSFQQVKRLDAKRRTRRAVEKRGKNLANGKQATEGIERKPIIKNPPGTGYCPREKKKVIMIEMASFTNSQGRKMIEGKCPDCGQVMQKYGNLIDCPECGKPAEAASDDYICKACRDAIA